MDGLLVEVHTNKNDVIAEMSFSLKLLRIDIGERKVCRDMPHNLVFLPFYVPRVCSC